MKTPEQLKQLARQYYMLQVLTRSKTVRPGSGVSNKPNWEWLKERATLDERKEIYRLRDAMRARRAEE